MGYEFNNRRLNAIRKERKWTGRELAYRAGCSEPQMHRLLRGERLISQLVLANLKKNAGIDPDYLEVDFNKFIRPGPRPHRKSFSQPAVFRERFRRSNYADPE
jgi:transcriptional regulator with XRE-family HTH domain